VKFPPRTGVFELGYNSISSIPSIEAEIKPNEGFPILSTISFIFD
jgi:hypothetical protein